MTFESFSSNVLVATSQAVGMLGSLCWGGGCLVSKDVAHSMLECFRLCDCRCHGPAKLRQCLVFCFATLTSDCQLILLQPGFVVHSVLRVYCQASSSISCSSSNCGGGTNHNPESVLSIAELSI